MFLILKPDSPKCLPPWSTAGLLASMPLARAKYSFEDEVSTARGLMDLCEICVPSTKEPGLNRAVVRQLVLMDR